MNYLDHRILALLTKHLTASTLPKHTEEDILLGNIVVEYGISEGVVKLLNKALGINIPKLVPLDTHVPNICRCISSKVDTLGFTPVSINEVMFDMGNEVLLYNPYLDRFISRGKGLISNSCFIDVSLCSLKRIVSSLSVKAKYSLLSFIEP